MRFFLRGFGAVLVAINQRSKRCSKASVRKMEQHQQRPPNGNTATTPYLAVVAVRRSPSVLDLLHQVNAVIATELCRDIRTHAQKRWRINST